MTWNRREVLGTLGIASASTLLATLGCRQPPQVARPTAPQVSTQVRTWLRDAIARLAAVYPTAHALAVSRHRVTAAIDTGGMGVARSGRTGVVLTVRDRAGVWREQVTSELTEAGVLAAVRRLVGTSTARAPVEFGAEPRPTPTAAPVDDYALRNRAGQIMRADQTASSRIVYAAALIDVDDVTVWSIAPGHDRESYLRRVRKHATRAAWNGNQPVVSEVARGWIGDLDDQRLTTDDVTEASRRALQLMTPGTFEDGERTVVLEPSVTTAIVDAAVRGLLTSEAARRPEVARRLPIGAAVAAPALTLVDDPTTPAAYGGFAFDDRGTPAAPTTLLDAGHVAGRLERGRRAGHVGRLEAAPSHLVLRPGTLPTRELFDDGYLLEGATTTVFDPSSDRIVIGIARAREIKHGSDTGRVFADVELVGDLGALLAAVTAVGAESRTIVIRDERDGEPTWRSIAAPWLRSRGLVRVRRSQA